MKYFIIIVIVVISNTFLGVAKLKYISFYSMTSPL